MQTAENRYVGKNQLWAAYLDAAPLVHDEVLLELKKAGLYRHWQTVASKEGYDLRNARIGLVEIFKKVMPETTHFFGLKPPPKSPKQPKPVAVDNTLRLFE